MAVMAQQRGVATRILYQLKMAIEQLGSTSVGRQREGAVAMLATTSTRTSKPVFDSAAANFFEKSIRAAAANQNQVYMDSHLRRFTREAERQAATAAANDDTMNQTMAAQKEMLRQQRLHQTRREHDVLHDAQEHGIREWERNWEIRLAQVYMQKRYKHAAAERRRFKKDIETHDSKHDVLHGITAFEETAARMGVTTRAEPAPVSVHPDPRSYDEFVEDLESAAPDSATMAAEAADYMDRLKARRAEATAACRARDKRRRAFLAASSARHVSAAAARRDARLAAMLARRSGAERQLAARVDVIKRHYDVFVADRKFREERYAERRKVDHEQRLARDEGLYALERYAHMHATTQAQHHHALPQLTPL